MLGLFWVSAQRKGDAALIDLRLLSGKSFSASLLTMFLMNGVAFAGQMLIPIYLIRGCGIMPSQAGWLMTPLGLGMLCSYPFIGGLTARFGVRRVAGGGASLALVGMLPFLYLVRHGVDADVLMPALFIRGMGMSGIGIPSITSAYGAMARKDLPMATGAMNIVQRLGGPTLTTLVATLLGWRLAAAPVSAASDAFLEAFALLCGLHLLLLLATLRLPRTVERLARGGPAAGTMQASAGSNAVSRSRR